MLRPHASRTILSVALVTLVSGFADWSSAFAQERIRADFNGDRFDDLAVGVPGERSASGGVNVIFGSPGGLQSTGNRFFSQAGDVPDTLEANDNCGAAVAAGDFNNDGFADLVMGCPGEDLGSATDMGAVNVLYGSINGLIVTGSQFFGFTDFSPSDISSGDKCASALVAGDFDGDKFDDLAIGCPGREFGVAVEGGGVADAGRVIVLFGSPAGLTTTGRQSLTQATPNVPDSPEQGDNCGAALAAGRFNSDAFADLAIGCPGEDVSSTDIGAVNVLVGSSTRLVGTGGQFFSFVDLPPGTISIQDRCGSALAAADFNRDGFDDLAMGCPGFDINFSIEGGGTQNVGRVFTLNGSASGITATGRLAFTQDTPDVPDAAEANDNCGAALAAADFNRDGFSDLVIGCPLEDVGGSDLGGVNALYGSSAGIAAANSQFFAFTEVISFADRCGTALAAGDFNNNGFADLVVGCPGHDIGVILGESVLGIFDAGRVIVLQGSAARLTTTGILRLTQDTPGIAGAAQTGDAFGFGLAGMGGLAGAGLTGAWRELTQRCHGKYEPNCNLRGRLDVINPSTQSVPHTVLRVYLSADSVLDPGDVLVHESGVGALKNGEAFTRTISIQLERGSNATGSYVIAFVDADNVVSEANEANNVIVFGPVK